MAVDTTVTVAGGGLYVPFRTPIRAGPLGNQPVGTLNVDANATGAAGGGTVTLRITMDVEEFGFRPIWCPTRVSVSDNLATAEAMELLYIATGNERLRANIGEVVVTVAVSGSNVGLAEGLPVPIQPNVAAGEIMRATWDTNTDTKIYHLHVFGPVFDAELLAREGEVADLLAGIR